MKTLFSKASFLMFAFIFMAETCAKDEKEKYIDEEESYREEMYGTREEIAVQEWQRCKRSADKLVAIAENNLKTVRSKIATANDYEKNQLDMSYEQHKMRLEKLKDEMERHNLIFKNPPKKIDDAVYNSYKSFNNFILQELIDLNTKLEEIVE